MEHREVGAKDVERFCKDVIVDEASVDGEATHHEDYVPSSKKYTEYFRGVCLLLKVFLLDIKLVMLEFYISNILNTL